MKILLALTLLFSSLFVTTQALASLNNAHNPMVAVVELGSISADADTYGVYLPRKSKIVSVKLVNSANITASDTDKAVVTLQNGSTVYATHTTAATGGSSLVANTPASATLATALVDNAGEIEVAAGSYLKVAYDESGTYAMTTAKVIIVYYPL